MNVRDLAALLVPPLCAACGADCSTARVLCGRCDAGLRAVSPPPGSPPRGLDACWSSAPHAGVARDLVSALKFRGLLPVAALMAQRVDRLGPAVVASAVIVPVPTAMARRRKRGFDPALELARHLADLRRQPLHRCIGRLGSARQVGRTRSRRLREPPRFRAVGPAPRQAILVDDVLTTGATLGACATVLRASGAICVSALTFARTL